MSSSRIFNMLISSTMLTLAAATKTLTSLALNNTVDDSCSFSYISSYADCSHLDYLLVSSLLDEYDLFTQRLETSPEFKYDALKNYSTFVTLVLLAVAGNHLINECRQWYTESNNGLENPTENLDAEEDLAEEKEHRNELSIRLNKINFHDDTINKRFICPIAKEIMEHPVIASDGHTYEEREIQRWMKHHMTSPVEGTQIEIDKTLYPNKDLRSEILEFIESAERNHAKKSMLKK